MLNAVAYQHDAKAQLHERLPELARSITRPAGVSNVRLDSFILSTTPYGELHEHYEDGAWSREDFADKHILFLERGDGYDYLAQIFQGNAV